MSSHSLKLPEAFADLEPFLEWALDAEAERVSRRQASRLEDLQKLYDAMLPRMDAILEHLNQYPLTDMPGPEKVLLKLSLSFAEVAPAVEWYGQAKVINGLDVEQWPLVREPEQTW